MKHAKTALSTAYADIDVDDIEDIQDDLADMMLDAEEINEVMGRSYGVPDDIDESGMNEYLLLL